MRPNIKIDFQKVHFAANNVLIMLNMIHATKNLFPSVENYENYDKYKGALEELANQSNKVSSSTCESTALVLPRFYTREGAAKMSADDLCIFYDEVIRIMSNDLGSMLSFEKH